MTQADPGDWHFGYGVLKSIPCSTTRRLRVSSRYASERRAQFVTPQASAGRNQHDYRLFSGACAPGSVVQQDEPAPRPDGWADGGCGLLASRYRVCLVGRAAGCHGRLRIDRRRNRRRTLGILQPTEHRSNQLLVAAGILDSVAHRCARFGDLYRRRGHAGRHVRPAAYGDGHSLPRRSGELRLRLGHRRLHRRRRSPNYGRPDAPASGVELSQLAAPLRDGRSSHHSHAGDPPAEHTVGSRHACRGHPHQTVQAEPTRASDRYGPCCPGGGDLWAAELRGRCAGKPVPQLATAGPTCRYSTLA